MSQTSYSNLLGHLWQRHPSSTYTRVRHWGRGFLKTDDDRRVVNDVIRKSRLPENTQADREREDRKKRDRQAVNKYAGHKIYNNV